MIYVVSIIFILFVLFILYRVWYMSFKENGSSGLPVTVGFCVKQRGVLLPLFFPLYNFYYISTDTKLSSFVVTRDRLSKGDVIVLMDYSKDIHIAKVIIKKNG